MLNQQQTVILSRREDILTKINGGDGSLMDRMKSVVPDVQELGRLMNKWIDDQAIQYRTAGMELEEWYDDIVQWMQNHKFMIEEIEHEQQSSGFHKCIMHCHLSNEGMGRHVVMKFTLLR